MFLLQRRAVRLVALSVALAVATASAVWTTEAAAQGGGGFGRGFGAVGGVSINPEGVLQNAQPDALRTLRDARSIALKKMPGDMNAPNDLRKVSLRQLQTALLEARKNGTAPPAEMRILAGLQRVQYVFVYPEEKDIVLAGFGEGTKIDERGNIVGRTTGRPVLQLDDLLLSLRSARTAAQGGISCSIDPTPDGMRRLQEYVSTLNGLGDPAVTIANIEQQLGPQSITLRGVLPTSHFAQVMVAADYRMKRIAMKFDPSPVKGLPSYLDLIGGGSRGSNMQPRWWLATNYEPLLTDEGGLAWELRGPGVKVMTEDSFFEANGQRVVQAGKTSPAAQKWADLMTSKYAELSVKDPIFGELRNCMDLAVIAALIFKEDLPRKAGCDLSGLMSDSELPLDEYVTPKQVPTIASYIQKSGNTIISASGGVEINSWAVADKKQKGDSLASPRGKVSPAKITHWWWN